VWDDRGGVNWTEIPVVLQGVFVPGDHNRDGYVDAADYVMWRKTDGQAVMPGFGADANFNGSIDQQDNDIWRQSFGASAGGTNGSIIIPDGQSSATVTIVPIDDDMSDFTETVTISLIPRTNYSLSPPVQATATILDNDVAFLVQDPAADGGQTNGTDSQNVAWYSNDVTAGTMTMLTVQTDVQLTGNVLNANNPTVTDPTYVQRLIVGDFSDRPVTLNNVGDSVYLKFDFRCTNTSFASTSENRFRFGILNAVGTAATGDNTTATRNDDGYWSQTSYGSTPVMTIRNAAVQDAALDEYLREANVLHSSRLERRSAFSALTPLSISYSRNAIQATASEAVMSIRPKTPIPTVVASVASAEVSFGMAGTA
jgi:hypothetical protein